MPWYTTNIETLSCGCINTYSCYDSNSSFPDPQDRAEEVHTNMCEPHKVIHDQKVYEKQKEDHRIQTIDNVGRQLEWLFIRDYYRKKWREIQVDLKIPLKEAITIYSTKFGESVYRSKKDLLSEPLLSLLHMTKNKGKWAVSVSHLELLNKYLVSDNLFSGWVIRDGFGTTYPSEGGCRSRWF